MRKPLLLVTSFFLAITSCKQAEIKPDKDGEDSFELPYNKEGITANKAFLEKEGRAFVNKVDDLSNNNAIKALESLADIGLPEISMTTSAFVNVGKSNQKIASISSTLNKIAMVGKTIETHQLKNAYGVYTYNHNTGDWVKTTSTEKLEFHFPAIKGGLSNNAILTLTYKASGRTFVYNDTEYHWEYDPNTGDYNNWEEDVEHKVELPSELKTSLKIGGTSALELISAFTYHSDNVPKSSNVNLTFGPYKFNTSVSNDNKDAVVNYSFSKGSDVLINVLANAKFDNLSYEKIENLDGEDAAADLFLNANTSIQVGNAKIAAHGDYQKINAETRNFRDQEPNYNSYFTNIKYPDYNDYPDYDAYQAAIDQYDVKYNAAYKKYRTDYEKYEKAYTDALAAAFNKNGAYVVINTKTNEILASVKFEVEEDSYSNGTESFSDKTYGLKPLLIFGDGSKVDFEIFSETGFDKLIEDVENLIDKFGN